MENQPISNSSNIPSINQLPVNQPVLPPQVKSNLMLPVLVTLLVSAFIFGVGGKVEFGNYIKTKYEITKGQNIFVQNHFAYVTDWSKWPEEDYRAVQRVNNFEVIHSDASDHLPLVLDFGI